MMALEGTKSRCAGLLVFQALVALAIYNAGPQDASPQAQTVPSYKHDQDSSKRRIS